MIDEWNQRTGGKPRRPVRVKGVSHPSLNAAVRGGTDWRALYRKIARGEAELLPQARPIDDPGAEGAARRVLRAAREIEYIAREGADAGGTQIEIAGRRRGLVKALWLYRERFGCGVSDVVEDV